MFNAIAKFFDFSSIIICERIPAAPTHAIITLETALVLLFTVAAVVCWYRHRRNEANPLEKPLWVPSPRAMRAGLLTYAGLALALPAAIYALRGSGLAIIMMHVCAPHGAVQAMLLFDAAIVLAGLLMMQENNSVRAMLKATPTAATNGRAQAEKEPASRARLPVPQPIPVRLAAAAPQMTPRQRERANADVADWHETTLH